MDDLRIVFWEKVVAVNTTLPAQTHSCLHALSYLFQLVLRGIANMIPLVLPHYILVLRLFKTTDDASVFATCIHIRVVFVFGHPVVQRCCSLCPGRGVFW